MPLNSVGAVTNETFVAPGVSDAIVLAPRPWPVNRTCAPLFAVRVRFWNRIAAFALAPAVARSVLNPAPACVGLPTKRFVVVVSDEFAVALPTYVRLPPLSEIVVAPLSRVATARSLRARTPAPWVIVSEPAPLFSRPVPPVIAIVPPFTVTLPTNVLAARTLSVPAPDFVYETGSAPLETAFSEASPST